MTEVSSPIFTVSDSHMYFLRCQLICTSCKSQSGCAANTISLSSIFEVDCLILMTNAIASVGGHFGRNNGSYGIEGAHSSSARFWVYLNSLDLFALHVHYNFLSQFGGKSCIARLCAFKLGSYDIEN